MSATVPEAKTPKPLEKLGKPSLCTVLLRHGRIGKQKYASRAELGYPFLHFAAQNRDIAPQ
jgi:hypothetical protein